MRRRAESDVEGGLSSLGPSCDEDVEPARDRGHEKGCQVLRHGSEGHYTSAFAPLDRMLGVADVFGHPP